MNGTQMKPAFCSHSVRDAGLDRLCGSPPIAPNTPMVITSGTTNCMTETPRLPRPAFMPRAIALLRLREEKADVRHAEAKLPPPKPHSSASTSMVVYGVVGSWTAMPMPRAGISRDAVEIAVHRRPPKIGP